MTTPRATMPPTTDDAPAAGRTWPPAGAVLATLARILLGVLWINEGILKWQAGFGRADILLVVHSTAQNPRVPGFYKFFTATALGHAPELFGLSVPIIEFGIGVALVLGVLTLPAALASAAELINYWFADQLITQYPIMIALSIVVTTFARSASRYSLTSLLMGRFSRRARVPARRWL